MVGPVPFLPAFLWLLDVAGDHSSVALSAGRLRSNWALVGALRGGGERTLPTQPWLTEGLEPECDPAGNIWETKSWRERLKRHQQEKAVIVQTTRDEYDSMRYVCVPPPCS